MAVKKIVDDETPAFLNYVNHAVSNGEILNISNATGVMRNHIGASPVLPHAIALLPVIQADERYKEACRLVEPILAEIAALEKQLEGERQELGHAENELREAREKATADALAKVEKDSKVAAALATVKRLGLPLQMATN